MDSNSHIGMTILVVAAINMMGCNDGSIGAPVGTLSLQYELVHMDVPTRIGRGDLVVGIRFNNPNAVPVNVDRITLTKLGTASEEVVEISMLDLDQGVYNVLQTREGDRYTFETETFEIPPGEHTVYFSVFVDEPCQTIGFTLQGDDDIVALGQNGEAVEISRGPNSAIVEPIQVFGNDVVFSPDSENPPPQEIQPGASNVVGMVFNVKAQTLVESRFTFAFLDYIPWEVAQNITDLRLSMKVQDQWQVILGPNSLNPEGCTSQGLDCYVQWEERYLLEACEDVKMRIEYSVSSEIPMETDIQVVVNPLTWGFYDLENDLVLTSENMSEDILRGSVFTVAP